MSSVRSPSGDAVGTAAAIERYEAGPALELIRKLASEIGPRRPCSAAEAEAGSAAVDWLAERGVQAETIPFQGFSSFAHPYGVMLGTSLTAALLQARGRRTGSALGLLALAALALEGDLRRTPVSDLVSRRTSANVVASVPAAEQERQRVCVCGHLDTSRSGLMFHPRLVPHLSVLFEIPIVSAAAVGLAPLLTRLPGGRLLRRAAIGGIVFGLVMLAERELRGSDVPGANDNASACGVVGQLVAECAARPLRHTRVDLLLTGCEEAGMWGAQAWARSDRERARSTVFVNFDSVGGDAPVRYILKEGIGLTRPATKRLVELVERIAERRPDLGLVSGRGSGALPTDATVALAHGAEAITFLARHETIPNYHRASDTWENIAPLTVARTLEAGRELLQVLDRDAGERAQSATPGA